MSLPVFYGAPSQCGGLSNQDFGRQSEAGGDELFGESYLLLFPPPTLAAYLKDGFGEALNRAGESTSV